MKINCKYCGKTVEYDRYNATKEFCDINCMYAYYGLSTSKKTVMKRCVYCNKEFECDESQKDMFFCNPLCASAFNMDKKSVIFNEIRKCAYCGGDFEWLSSYPSQKFCSSECNEKWTSENNIKKNIRTERRKCEYCGAEFDWFSNKPTQKYCSKECGRNANKIKVRQYNKKNKPEDVFLDGLRSEIYLKVCDIIGKMYQAQGETFNNRYIDYWQVGDITEKTREEVLNRDGFECQICKRKDSLHLHHLTKRRYGGSHEADNLITLCSSCHMHIETGDIHHATNKCLRNAKIYYHMEEKNNDIDIDDLRFRLKVLFDKMSASSSGDDSEIMIQLAEIIDMIDIDE